MKKKETRLHKNLYLFVFIPGWDAAHLVNIFYSIYRDACKHLELFIIYAENITKNITSIIFHNFNTRIHFCNKSIEFKGTFCFKIMIHEEINFSIIIT